MTPTGRHVRGFEEQSWKPTEEYHETKPIESTDFTRNSEERKSTTKRVKNYLKRCKNALAGNKSQPEQQAENQCSYWYVDNETKDAEEKTVEDNCEIFEKVGPNYNHNEEEVCVEEEEEEVEKEECKEDYEEDLKEETQGYVSDAEILFGGEVSLVYSIIKLLRDK